LAGRFVERLPFQAAKKYRQAIFLRQPIQFVVDQRLLVVVRNLRERVGRDHRFVLQRHFPPLGTRGASS
jgi:hypothetical protein